MTEPKSLDEYNKRYFENQKIEGYGIYGVGMRVPCPFCAAPDFIVHKVIETEEAFAKGAVCKECGRGAKAIFARDPSGVSFEIVQTSGPDQPEWLTPKMRRVDG